MGMFKTLSALKPMLTDYVRIIGTRKEGKDIEWAGKACLIDNGFIDPMNENSPSSSCRTITVTIPRQNWLDEFPPRIGDEIEDKFGDKWKVFSVRADTEVFNIDARECK